MARPSITQLPPTGLDRFRGLLTRADEMTGGLLAAVPGIGTLAALNRSGNAAQAGNYTKAVESLTDVIPVGRLASNAIRGITRGRSAGDIGGVLNAVKFDQDSGLPLNPDGTVTVYHHTSAANADKIRTEKKLRSAGEPDVYVTTRKDTDTGYGDTAVPIRVKPSLLQVDDEFPDGRVDYRINVGKKMELPIGLAIQGGLLGSSTDSRALNQFEYPQQAALNTAQRNAALPVEQGGLGLRPDNTPMERAKAIGYDVDNPLYHGTDKSFEAFDLSKLGSQTRIPLGFPQGIYTSPDASVAGRYGSQDGANVLKLLARSSNAQTPNVDGTPREVFDRFNAGNIDAVKSNSVTVLKDPSQLRSMFAAFDPMRRNEADLLAFRGNIGGNTLGNINPLLGLLDDENQ